MATIEKVKTGYKVTTPKGDVWEFNSFDAAKQFCKSRSYSFICK